MRDNFKNIWVEANISDNVRKIAYMLEESI